MSAADKSLIVFQGKKIRRTWFNHEWWFVAVDIVEVLTDSRDPNGYLKDMRRRDEGFAKGWGQIATPLWIDTTGGKQQINCVSTKGGFRLIQSIPSKKAEPFKQWLAQVGYDRVQEIENPELAQKRMKDLYKQKGYSDDWIEKRVRGIAIRDELTDEWNKRGVESEREYSILTAEISKATFGLTPAEYKERKGLKNENLRDHMNDLELIFSMLGERVTTEITRSKDAQEFNECSDAAKEGGEVAGNARKDAEKRIGKSIISSENYLEQAEGQKRKRLPKIDDGKK
ncbi:phage antirepressor protein [Candidatus Woesearchaeota archaeon]|nr:phage antirepressor protein [Candidatus Woesearchaeota archaeon]